MLQGNASKELPNPLDVEKSVLTSSTGSAFPGRSVFSESQHQSLEGQGQHTLYIFQYLGHGESAV